MKQPINPQRRLLSPVLEFIQAETTGGLFLLTCAILAMVLANSAWSEDYFNFWKTPFSVGFGSWVLSKSIFLWINDGLMAVFFFVVGLEIKRELLAGELSSFKQAMLPISAALGGMIVPAALYLLINYGKAGQNGWGIPMATDIAFALGFLSLFGKRVPVSLKIFLTALAIVDDLGAVIVIAVFYTADLFLANLFVGLICFAVLIVINHAGIRKVTVYVILGIIMWVAFLKSGIHPTLAGVLLAFTIPSRIKINSSAFPEHCRNLIDEYERAGDCGKPMLLCETQQTAVQSIETACHYAESPMQRLEHHLHPWVSFVIMPLFAIANAGIILNEELITSAFDPISIGVFIGLAIGKPVGITLFSWTAVKLNLARLPGDIQWKSIIGVSCIAGIGFTMSLFIADLAFNMSHQLDVAKIGIFSASIVAGTGGWLLLRKGKDK
jgi:Na+:H+ antiporter, NhaA family